MISAYKDRKIENGQLVQVYVNLHGGEFSIKEAKTGYLLAHGYDFLLLDARPIVSKQSHQSSGYVCVEGYIQMQDFLYEIHRLDTLHYNPHTSDSFILKRNKIDFKGGDLLFTEDEVKVVVAERKTRRHSEYGEDSNG